MNDVGLVEDGAFEFPLTQPELGEYLALSSVHINRTLQTLRRDGLVQTSNRHMTITDFPRLAAIAGFDGSYIFGARMRDLKSGLDGIAHPDDKPA